MWKWLFKNLQQILYTLSKNPKREKKKEKRRSTVELSATVSGGGWKVNPINLLILVVNV